MVANKAVNLCLNNIASSCVHSSTTLDTNEVNIWMLWFFRQQFDSIFLLTIMDSTRVQQKKITKFGKCKSNDVYGIFISDNSPVRWICLWVFCTHIVCTLYAVGDNNTPWVHCCIQYIRNVWSVSINEWISIIKQKPKIRSENKVVFMLLCLTQYITVFAAKSKCPFAIHIHIVELRVISNKQKRMWPIQLAYFAVMVCEYKK